MVYMVYTNKNHYQQMEELDMKVTSRQINDKKQVARQRFEQQRYQVMDWTPCYAMFDVKQHYRDSLSKITNK